MLRLGLGGLTYSCLDFFFLPPGPNAVPGLLTFGQLHVLDHMLLPTFLCSDSGVALLKASHEQTLTPTCSLLIHYCSFEYLYVVSAPRHIEHCLIVCSYNFKYYI